MLVKVAVLLVVACIGACTAVTCGTDLILVLDGSSSISGQSWASMTEFCASLAGKMNVSEEGAHIGAVQFSSRSSSKVVLPLTSDVKNATATLASLKQFGGSTDTTGGLTLALHEFEARERGGSVPTVLILITDGKADASPVAIANEIKARNTTIIGIGVGTGADMKQIAEIVSAPASQYAMQLGKFSDLAAIISELLAMTCAEVLRVSPDSGPEAGGTAVKVIGAGLVAGEATAMTCRFGSVTVPVLSYVDETLVVCQTPPRGSGDPSTVPVSYAYDGASFATTKATYHYEKGGGCPTPDCGGHGVCAGDQCICDEGWTGPNCDQKGCPKDCCGHGTCDPASGTCMCQDGYTGADCCSERIMCCQYCIPDPNNPGHYKPASWRAECWKGFCPGRFPAVAVDSWQVNTTAGLDGCIFNKDPQTNRPCIYNYGDCK